MVIQSVSPASVGVIMLIQSDITDSVGVIMLINFQVVLKRECPAKPSGYQLHTEEKLSVQMGYVRG
jgi:hypothetical protein